MSDVSRSKTALGLSSGLLMVCVFSGFTIASRFGLKTSLRPMDLAMLRFAVSSCVLLPVLLLRGFDFPRRRAAIAASLLGGPGFALPAFFGLALAPAAHGSVLLHGTLPLSTFVVSVVFWKTAVSRAGAAGLVAIAFGLGAMLVDSMAGASWRQGIGDGLLVAASLSWASYALAIRRVGLDPPRAAATVAIVSTIVFLPIYLLSSDRALLQADWRDIAFQAAFQGVLVGATTTFLYVGTVSILGAAVTAALVAAVPCLTTVLAIPILGEWPSRTSVAGVAMVSIGMLVSVLPALVGGRPRFRSRAKSDQAD